MAFGKKTTSLSAPVDSDGKRRVFGEAIHATHGALLNALGFDINDPSNILPEQADFDALVQRSLETQELRRQGIEADLLARHGCNAIRPFFLFSEGVYNRPLGAWLIQVMRLLPYDDWNITYLPMDARTATAMRLPLHPQGSITPVEELVTERLSPLWKQFTEARNRAYRAFERTGDLATLEQFNRGAERMRQDILDYAGAMTPKVIALIADVQANPRGPKGR